jgi:hypothetical protein
LIPGRANKSLTSFLAHQITKEDTKAPLCTPRCKHFNLYWLASAGIAVSFFFVHTLLLHLNIINPILLVHLIGVYSIYLTCIPNMILTPRTIWKYAKPFLIWAGCFKSAMGIAGFAVGA